MRILFFENNPAYFLSHRAGLARHLREQGHEIHVASIPGDATKRIVESGFTFHAISFSRSGRNPFGELLVLIRICRLYRTVQPDLVYQVTVKPVIYGSLAARFVGVKSVVSVISGLGYSATLPGLTGKVFRRIVFFLYRAALRHPRQRIVFHNNEDLKLFVRKRIVSAAESVVIPGSGVDMEHYRVTEEVSGIPTAVLPARMLRDKGVVEFVEAARILRENGVQARFVLAGDVDPGNPSAISEDELRQWNRDGAIEWVGHVRDMRKLYETCHVVCLPSYREGLAKALIEAAACGRPVISTRVPGCRDAVLDGETGLLVAPRDSRQLAEGLQRLLQDTALRRDMGSKGRDFAENNFSVEHIVLATMNLIARLEPSTA